MSRNPPASFLPSHHAVDTSAPDDLERIREGGVNLVVWNRGPSAAIAAEVDDLIAASFPDVRCGVTRAGHQQEVAELFRSRGYDSRGFPHWMDDIHELTRRFHALAGDRPVTLRMETTDGDGCRRFHVDRCHLRLLCTYRGPGTQWLHNHRVDHHALAHLRPHEDILRHGIPAPMEPFRVAVMKGEHYPGNALVHRSPPLDGSGHTRVLLCLDC